MCYHKILTTLTGLRTEPAGDTDHVKKGTPFVSRKRQSTDYLCVAETLLIKDLKHRQSLTLQHYCSCHSICCLMHHLRLSHSFLPMSSSLFVFFFFKRQWESRRKSSRFHRVFIDFHFPCAGELLIAIQGFVLLSQKDSLSNDGGSTSNVQRMGSNFEANMNVSSSFRWKLLHVSLFICIFSEQCILTSLNFNISASSICLWKF